MESTGYEIKNNTNNDNKKEKIFMFNKTEKNMLDSLINENNENNTNNNNFMINNKILFNSTVEHPSNCLFRPRKNTSKIQIDANKIKNIFDGQMTNNNISLFNKTSNNNNHNNLRLTLKSSSGKRNSLKPIILKNSNNNNTSNNNTTNNSNNTSINSNNFGIDKTILNNLKIRKMPKIVVKDKTKNYDVFNKRIHKK
jgi:hypothetical protein